MPNGATGLSDDAIPSLAMVHWLAARDPQAMRQARHVLSVSEWIVRDLGGVTAAEPSLASRTAALAISDRAWWPEAIAWAGLSPDIFGELRQAGTPWGAVGDSIEGLESIAGATLTAAGHDHLVAAVGSGLTTTGQVMDSCGTAEALLRPIPADPDIDLSAVVARGVNCGWHVLPDVYNLIVGLRLGLDLAPLLERLGSTSRGGRTPLDADALAWLALGGATADTGADARADIGPDAVRAWAEATRDAVDAAAHALDELRDLGGPIDEVLIGGGWAANPVLQTLKQNAFPSPFYPQVNRARRPRRRAVRRPGRRRVLRGHRLPHPTGTTNPSTHRRPQSHERRQPRQGHPASRPIGGRRRQALPPRPDLRRRRPHRCAPRRPRLRCSGASPASRTRSA